MLEYDRNFQQPFLKEYNVSFNDSKTSDKFEKVDLKIYPNPSIGNNVTIEYFLPKTGSVNIYITNSKGMELVKLKNRNLHESGTYKIDIKLNNYTPGIYFVRIVTEKETITGKLIKQ